MPKHESMTSNPNMQMHITVSLSNTGSADLEVAIKRMSSPIRAYTVSNIVKQTIGVLSTSVRGIDTHLGIFLAFARCFAFSFSLWTIRSVCRLVVGLEGFITDIRNVSVNENLLSSKGWSPFELELKELCTPGRP